MLRLPLDRVTLGVVLLLVLIGLVNLYSASFYFDKSVFLKQVIWVTIGLVLMVILTFTKYEKVVNWAVQIYVVFLLLTILTLIIGREVRGTKSWLNIAGMGIQPSEFLKVGVLLLATKYLSGEGVNPGKLHSFLTILGIFALPVGVILLQPDLGMAISYLIFFLMFSLIAGVNSRYLLMLLFLAFSLVFFPFFNAYLDFLVKVGIIEKIPTTVVILISREFAYALLASSIFVFVVATVVSRILRDKVRLILGLLLVLFSIGFLVGNVAYTNLKPYQKNRLMVFFSPEVDRLGAGYNVIQSEIAVGSGGLVGKGLLNGSQNKLNILPERHTDFAFSVLAEEWGFIGSGFVIALFVILFLRLFWLVGNVEDIKAYLIVCGVIILILINFTINMFMVLGLAPVTGLPLPFISYGGSAIVTNLALIGIVNNIYRERFLMY